MNLRHAALFLLLTLFVGCAIEGKPYEAPATAPTKSSVYIYRPYNLFAVLKNFHVNCGDSSVAIGPGAYHLLVLDPERVRCSAHTEVTTAVEFEAKAGESYYIRESIWPGVILPHVHLDLKPSDEAMAEIRKCAQQ